MNKIVFPLKLGMKGAEVADLQDALQAMIDQDLFLARDDAAARELGAALKEERRTQAFGSVTRRAVAALQRELHLEASGSVDETTAKAINKLLRIPSGVDPVVVRPGPQPPVTPAPQPPAPQPPAPQADDRTITGIVILEHGGGP